MGSIFRLGSSIKSLTYSPALFLNLSTKVSTESAIPKRPPHAFNLFVVAYQKEAKEKNGPGLIKEAASNWMRLDAEKKQEYVDKAESLRLKYQEEVSQFPKGKLKEMRSEDKKTVPKLKNERRLSRRHIFEIKRKQLGRPRQPLRTFVRFLLEYRPENPIEKKNICHDFLNKMAEKWHSLDSETKKEYKNKYKTDLMEYTDEMRCWVENLLVYGVPDGISPEVLSSLIEEVNRFKDLKEKPQYEIRKKQWLNRIG